ncbi:MAG: sulfatase [Verrucomicrobiales bacterium]|nr:sulfatase [Verrucomicrobiales bacterium]|tara:strand:- start:10892 stop:12337 length:1446 start_codon:yes stop_codon:yes gene_type:complete
MTSLCTGHESSFGLSRRQLLNRFGMGLGGIALSDLLARSAGASSDSGSLRAPHFPGKAKRVIYLFMSGGPSQMDLYDYKPVLNKRHGEELPPSIRGNQRLTAMSGNQASLPMAGSPFKFEQHGQSGAWLCDRLPHLSAIADDLCFVKSMYTEAINHGPGVTFMQTGSPFPGRPSIGAWLHYGLGAANEDLPAFVVLKTAGKGGQPLGARMWGNGFLPSRFQGVRFRSGKDPVLYLNNPAGIDAAGRRKMLDRLNELHQIQLAATGDPEIETRIAQYEMSYRMQASVPEVMDMKGESSEIMQSYGLDIEKPGSFAANCLLARRLAERGVRFIQLYHPGWDQHGGLPGRIGSQCKEVDRPAAALVKDLKRRGLLDDTLVIWGGEFGRTSYCQGKLTEKSFGRDHHPRCFSYWMAGGGIKPGVSYGKTDDFCYNIAENGVHIHDFHATLLHLLGIDHERLTYRFQGRRFRLTDVHGHVVKPIVA